MTDLDLIKIWMNNPKNIQLIKRFKIKDTNSFYFKKLLTSTILSKDEESFKIVEKIFKDIFEIKKDTKQFLLELGFDNDLTTTPFNNQKKLNINYLKDNWYTSKEELLSILLKTKPYTIDTSNKNEVFLDDIFRYFEAECNTWLIAAITIDFEEINSLLNSLDRTLSYDDFYLSFNKLIYKFINDNGIQKQNKDFVKPFIIKRNGLIEFKESHYTMPDVIYFDKNTKQIHIFNTIINLNDGYSIMPLIQLFRIDRFINGLNSLNQDLKSSLKMLNQKQFDLTEFNNLKETSYYYQNMIQKYLLDNNCYNYLTINIVYLDKDFSNNGNFREIIIQRERENINKHPTLDKDNQIFLIQMYKNITLRFNLIQLI